MVWPFSRCETVPPRLEELKKEAAGILALDIFDGARFEFNKTLTQKFALNHNVMLGSSQIPTGYEFGANFGDDRVLLASRTDMGGRLNGRVHAQLSDAVLLRMQAQMSPEAASPSSLKVDFDFKGRDFTTGATYMAGGLLGAHYMQSLTKNLVVGGEGFYHTNRQIKGGSVAARVVWGPKDEHIATAKAGSFGQGELSYQRKVRRPPLTFHTHARSRRAPARRTPRVAPRAHASGRSSLAPHFHARALNNLRQSHNKPPPGTSAEIPTASALPAMAPPIELAGGAGARTRTHACILSPSRRAALHVALPGTTGLPLVRRCCRLKAADAGPRPPACR